MRIYNKWNKIPNYIIILFVVIAVLNLAFTPALFQANDKFNIDSNVLEQIEDGIYVGELNLADDIEINIDHAQAIITHGDETQTIQINELKSMISDVYITSIISHAIQNILILIFIISINIIFIQVMFKMRLRYKLLLPTVSFSLIITQLTLFIYFINPRYTFFIEIFVFSSIFVTLLRNIINNSLYEYMTYSKEYE